MVYSMEDSWMQERSGSLSAALASCKKNLWTKMGLHSYLKSITSEFSAVVGSYLSLPSKLTYVLEQGSNWIPADSFLTTYVELY